VTALPTLSAERAAGPRHQLLKLTLGQHHWHSNRIWDPPRLLTDRNQTTHDTSRARRTRCEEDDLSAVVFRLKSPDEIICTRTKLSLLTRPETPPPINFDATRHVCLRPAGS
jgi:hypothetical protein